MALVNFKKGVLASLPATYTEGTFYVTTDERAIYLDIGSEARIRLGDFQEVASVEELNKISNKSETALYYVKSINCLAKWDGQKFIQINTDTGATSVEVVGGDVNGVSIAYNAETRKITLTMSKAFVTANDVDGQIAAKIGQLGDGYSTVKEYVDAKTDGIATDDALSELSGRVDAAESDIEKLQELVGDESVADQIGAAIEEMSLDTTYVKVGALDGDIADAKKAGTDAKAAVDTLAGKVGEVPDDKTVVQMIADAQSAATYDDTQVKADIKANADAIAKLNDGAEVAGSVDYKIAQAVAAIMENPDETMNSINELVTWINGHAEDALELSNKVSANEQDIDALETLVGGTAVATQITEAIAAALKVEGADKYALATELVSAIARIAAMEAKVTGWDQAVADKHTHSNSDALDEFETGDKDKLDTAASTASANATAISDMKNGTDIDSFGDVEDALEGKQDVIPENTYDAYGAATTAESNANAYTDAALTWGTF